MLDGRVWWELRKQGVPEKRKLTVKQIAANKAWAAEQAARKGWL